MGQGRNQSNQGSRDRNSTGKGGRDFNRSSGANDNRGHRGNGRERDGEGFTVILTPEQAIEAVGRKLPSMANGYIKMGREECTPTANQKKILHLAKSKTALFVDGPFGTGKTLWSCYAALQGLAEGRFDKIALTAPAVEADEQIGFLKGTMKDKMSVHVNQILETIDDLIGKNLREQLEESGIIEIAPHAFNRGRTYKNTCYLLDECQNASARQLLTSIGRVGIGSTFIYMGDNEQNDRTTEQKSAFVAFIDRFTQPAYERFTGSVKLGMEDCKRHPFLHAILERGDNRPLDGFESRQDSKIVTGRPRPAPAHTPG